MKPPAKNIGLVDKVSNLQDFGLILVAGDADSNSAKIAIKTKEETCAKNFLLHYLFFNNECT